MKKRSQLQGQRSKRTTMTMRGGKAKMQETMEEKNDEMTDKLAGKVELLRKISINIGKEIEDQNTELDGLNDKSGNILDSLGGTMKGLMGLAMSGGTRPLLVRSVSMFGIFIVIYFFSSRYSAAP